MAAYDQYISAMQQQSEANNVFNAKQAEINRNFQLEMSNTAHQREVKDLIAAGLNPVLSANAGASTAAGSSATADTSSAQGFAQLANTGMNNITQLALAEINKAAQLQAAQISAQAVVESARLSSDAARFGAQLSYQKSPVGAVDTIMGKLFGGSNSAILNLPDISFSYPTTDANKRLTGYMSSGNSAFLSKLYKNVQARR